MERGIRITLNQDATRPRTYRTIEVHGLSAERLKELRDPAMTEERWRAILRVYVDPEEDRSGSSDRPPSVEVSGTRGMLSRHEVEGGLVRFLPRFPLLEGQRYLVRLDLDGGFTESLSVPKEEAPPTRVLRIHPSADLWPENTLRIYICFSAPMREGESLKHIRLLDSADHEVAGVFLDPMEELWDPGRTRLTLLFDPGRVKTGLRAHQQLGRALIAGQRYRLEIDGEWRDARGERLESAAEKRFTATHARLHSPEVSEWRLEVPRAGTCDPLSLRFPEPLDHGLLSEFLCVQRADGSVLHGAISVEQAELGWHFRPTEPWVAGDYTVQVDRRLEDPSGNSLHGLFDRPISEQSAPADSTAVLRFQV